MVYYILAGLLVAMVVLSGGLFALFIFGARRLNVQPVDITPEDDAEFREIVRRNFPASIPDVWTYDHQRKSQ